MTLPAPGNPFHKGALGDVGEQKADKVPVRNGTSWRNGACNGMFATASLALIADEARGQLRAVQPSRLLGSIAELMS